MPSTLRDICFDCTDAHRVSEFWAAVLGGELDTNGRGDYCVTVGGNTPRYWFNQVPEPKTVKNRVHIDVDLPNAAEVSHLESLGAVKLREIRDDEGTLMWTIMADMEGNEFCAFPPR